MVCTAAQSEVVAEAENILKLHNRRHCVLETFSSALPKHVLAREEHSVKRVALKEEVVDHIPTEVPDGAFASAMRFVHTRYLAGQAVLAVSVKEKIWAGREWPGIWCPCWCESCEAVQAPTLPWTASKASISNLNEICARPGTAAFAAAHTRLEEFWRLIAVSRDAYEHFYLRKYHRNALCRNTVDWLEQNRVPGFMLGVGEATCSRGTNTKAVALRGTNPSVTVRASHGTAAQAMVAASQEQAAATSEPLVPMTKEKKPMSTARMLHSEIVEGILLDKKAAPDVNPLAHDRNFLFQGKCLWCKDAAQAVVCKGT